MCHKSSELKSIYLFVGLKISLETQAVSEPETLNFVGRRRVLSSEDEQLLEFMQFAVRKKYLFRDH